MDNKSLRTRLLFWIVMFVSLGLDQSTKVWVESHLLARQPIVVLPGFLELVYVQNTGVAFGFMQHHNFWLAILTPLILVTGFYLARDCNWSRAETRIVAGLLCGGALGNWLDRLRLGYVIDFVDCHVGKHHWPAFNVADSCLCIGVTWILWRTMFGKGCPNTTAT